MSNLEREIIREAVLGKPNSRHSGAVIIARGLVKVGVHRTRAKSEIRGWFCGVYTGHITTQIACLLTAEYGEQRLTALLWYLQQQDSRSDQTQEALLTELLTNYVPRLLMIPYHSY